MIPEHPLNAIALQFASGHVFFYGVCAVLAASAVSLLDVGRKLRMVLNVSILLGVVLVLLSAVPLHPILYAALIGLALGGAAGFSRDPYCRRSRCVLGHERVHVLPLLK